jgi:hypothetical protein
MMTALCFHTRAAAFKPGHRAFTAPVPSDLRRPRIQVERVPDRGRVTQADISRYGSYAEARRMKDMGRG